MQPQEKAELLQVVKVPFELTRSKALYNSFLFLHTLVLRQTRREDLSSLDLPLSSHSSTLIELQSKVFVCVPT